MWVITPVVTGTTTIIGTTLIMAAGDRADTGTGPRTIALVATAMPITAIAAAGMTVGAMAEAIATMDAMMITVTTIAVIVVVTPVHVTTVRTTISTVTDRNARRSPVHETSKHVRRIVMLTIPVWYRTRAVTANRFEITQVKARQAKAGSRP